MSISVYVDGLRKSKRFADLRASPISARPLPPPAVPSSRVHRAPFAEGAV
jgi:hypothetical protein